MRVDEFWWTRQSSKLCCRANTTIGGFDSHIFSPNRYRSHEAYPIGYAFFFGKLYHTILNKSI